MQGFYIDFKVRTGNIGSSDKIPVYTEHIYAKLNILNIIFCVWLNCKKQNILTLPSAVLWEIVKNLERRKVINKIQLKTLLSINKCHKTKSVGI